MELENIKLQTTWNDAAASINTNFSKIKRAVRDGIPVVDTPVDDIVSDTSENAIQNKVIKKYVDDEIVTLEGYAEEVVNDLENNIKTNPSEYVKLKTINGRSLYGSGNIVIAGGEGGAGLQYAIERTVYIGQMFIDGECIGTGELSDEERAYNVETYRMAAIDFEPVFLSFEGYFLPLLYTASSASNPNEGQAKFGIVVSLDPSGLDSISVTITGGGDAIARAEGIETGSSVPSDMNSDFSNDF